MTVLSININKIALIRNSRGRNYPDVVAFAARCLDFGAGGITLHPRPDQRHARYSDVAELSELCQARGVELNVEGYPTPEFLEVVKQYRPAQCTLVPDAPDQLTSDHGWDVHKDGEFLRPILAELKALNIRTSLFVDYTTQDMAQAKAIGADRVELYTEPYAEHFGTPACDAILAGFHAAALRAQEAGLEVNAGHDLNLDNLGQFLTIPNILEVSIGHAFVVECLDLGMQEVLRRYSQICQPHQ
ncbi:pyridoxine 5'-phosphate synthase [Chitinibacter sp. SCUT-21]|uniref:pyridoxine 5'-phosphate synthase n=1 Tax=Chitinibacter sp. SCUT-21 TaxID=2970891 RepID=UPI0035A5E4B3